MLFAACRGRWLAQSVVDQLKPLAATSSGRRMEQAIAAIRAAIDDGRMRPGVMYSGTGKLLVAQAVQACNGDVDLVDAIWESVG